MKPKKNNFLLVAMFLVSFLLNALSVDTALAYTASPPQNVRIESEFKNDNKAILNIVWDAPDLTKFTEEYKKVNGGVPQDLASKVTYDIYWGWVNTNVNPASQVSYDNIIDIKNRYRNGFEVFQGSKYYFNVFAKITVNSSEGSINLGGKYLEYTVPTKSQATNTETNDANNTGQCRPYNLKTEVYKVVNNIPYVKLYWTYDDVNWSEVGMVNGHSWGSADCRAGSWGGGWFEIYLNGNKFGSKWGKDGWRASNTWEYDADLGKVDKSVNIEVYTKFANFDPQSKASTSFEPSGGQASQMTSDPSKLPQTSSTGSTSSPGAATGSDPGAECSENCEDSHWWSVDSQIAHAICRVQCWVIGVLSEILGWCIDAILLPNMGL